MLRTLVLTYLLKGCARNPDAAAALLVFDSLKRLPRPWSKMNRNAMSAPVLRGRTSNRRGPSIDSMRGKKRGRQKTSLRTPELFSLSLPPTLSLYVGQGTERDGTGSDRIFGGFFDIRCHKGQELEGVRIAEVTKAEVLKLGECPCKRGAVWKVLASVADSEGSFACGGKVDNQSWVEVRACDPSRSSVDRWPGILVRPVLRSVICNSIECTSAANHACLRRDISHRGCCRDIKHMGLSLGSPLDGLFGVD